jgi:hypothetical protein
MCKNYNVNELDNTLYDLYNLINSAKAPWEALDKNYKAEDVGINTFIVSKFIDFKVVDSWHSCLPSLGSCIFF